jgi:hypothetical protein
MRVLVGFMLALAMTSGAVAADLRHGRYAVEEAAVVGEAFKAVGPRRASRLHYSPCTRCPGSRLPYGGLRRSYEARLTYGGLRKTFLARLPFGGLGRHCPVSLQIEEIVLIRKG